MPFPVRIIDIVPTTGNHHIGVFGFQLCITQQIAIRIWPGLDSNLAYFTVGINQIIDHYI